MKKVGWCVNCDRIHHQNKWEKIHPYILGYIIARGDDYELTLCPTCDTAIAGVVLGEMMEEVEEVSAN